MRRTFRIVIAGVWCLMLCLTVGPLEAQRGKKPQKPPFKIDVTGRWTTDDGRFVAIGQYENDFTAVFFGGHGQCPSGQNRAVYLNGTITPDDDSAKSYAIRGTIKLCTDPTLWKDCHGKGLAPDTDAWDQTFTGEIVMVSSIKGKRIISYITLLYKGQHYDVKKDDKTKQVIGCTPNGTSNEGVVLSSAEGERPPSTPPGPDEPDRKANPPTPSVTDRLDAAWNAIPNNLCEQWEKFRNARADDFNEGARREGDGRWGGSADHRHKCTPVGEH